jgi:hypothetical protein
VADERQQPEPTPEERARVDEIRAWFAEQGYKLNLWWVEDIGWWTATWIPEGAVNRTVGGGKGGSGKTQLEAAEDARRVLLGPGLVFVLSDGGRIRVSANGVRELLRYLHDAPGGPRGSPSASSAAAKIQHAVDRWEEEGRFELTDAEEGEMHWALDREMGKQTPADLVELRHHLGDIASRVG